MYSGTQIFFNDAVAGTKVTVKAAPGYVRTLRLLNKTAAVAYLQCFNKLAAAVTVGTTVPDFCITLAANESLSLPLGTGLIEFGTGLVIAGCTSATGSTGAAIATLIVYE